MECAAYNDRVSAAKCQPCSRTTLSTMFPTVQPALHEKCRKVGAWRHLAQLTEKRDSLASMVRRVIDDVLHHFTERQLPLLTLKVFETDRLIHTLISEGLDEGDLIRFKRRVSRFKTLDIRKLLCVPQRIAARHDLFGRLPQPTPQPYPMAADDVNKGPSHRRVTGLKVAHEIFTGKTPRRR